MLIDSEEPTADPERTWDHLKARDGWDRPPDSDDEQVLFMTTCMETWIACDRGTLRRHYGPNIQESALPPLHDIEQRDRHAIQDALFHATRNCRNPYRKGWNSFEVLGRLDPETLEAHLAAFRRTRRILDEKLQ
ncbi:hypothetical protein ASZ90_009434 [hydrocarbon metagenome]|uniref:Uncharacterized protein n=1 Tax=hydrocarbon metagenome TaxID=938273 RepID=A0A0W8FIZ5_9ZZZZ